MKLDDIIDQSLSLYNFLGKTGGNALPYTGKQRTVNTTHGSLITWSRITEEQRGGEYDPSFAKFGNPDSNQKDNKFGWAKTSGGDSITVSGRGRKTRKIIVRKSGESSIETIDDEGNHQLHDTKGNAKTGKINFKNVHTGARAESLDDSCLDNQITEVQSGTGTGLGGSGATQPPVSGPAELEFDLTKVHDEFKGKDTRGDIKKSKAKRITLKQFLDRRTNRETDRVTAAAN